MTQLTTYTADQFQIDARNVLTACKQELRSALDELAKHAGNAVLAAVRVGHAALTAKDAVPEGQFTKWLEAEFPDFSAHWSRRCMAAARNYQLLTEQFGSDERDAVMKHMTSVEKLANLGRLMDKGDKVEGSKLLLALEEQPKKTMGRPKVKGTSAPKGDKLDEGEEPAARKANRAADQDERELELEQWEDRLRDAQRVLESKQADLEAWEARLEERERQLTLTAAMVDAAPAAPAEDHVPAEQVYEGIDKPKWPDTPAMAAAKANAVDAEVKTKPAKGGGAAVSRVKTKGKAKGASTPDSASENGPF